MTNEKIVVKYQVRFVCYQHNCGGTVKNGDQLCKKNFPDLDSAKKFAEKVKSLCRDWKSNVPEGSRDFASDFVADGYVEKFVGVYKITEEFVQ